MSSFACLFRLVMIMSLVFSSFSMSHASMMSDDVSQVAHEAGKTSMSLAVECDRNENNHSSVCDSGVLSAMDQNTDTHQSSHSEACAYAFCAAAIAEVNSISTPARLAMIYDHSKIASIRLSELNGLRRPPKS